MVQATMVANSLTYTAAIDFIKIINVINGNKAVPESEYIFKKVCTEGINYKKRLFCRKCYLKIDSSNESNIERNLLTFSFLYQ